MKTKSTRLSSLAALLSCLPCLHASAAGPAAEAVWVAQAAPTSLEADYWRSAEKLGTPDAYRAYLATFPNGFYARLAAAALAKADTAAPQQAQPAPPLVQHQVRSTAPSPTPSPGFTDAAMLQKIAGDADSSAVSFQIGDVFAGPGPLTVGRFGSRKQFVVPTGRWVALAAEDGYSTHRTPIQMTAMAFALFEGQVVRSIVTAAFDRRPGPSGSIPNWTWNDAQRCEAGAADAKFHWRGVTGLVKQCVLVTAFPKLEPSGSWKGNIWDAVHGSLGKLGVRTDGAKGLVTDLYLTDNRNGYMRVSRYDFGSAEAGGSGQDAALLDLRLEARVKWAQEYAALAALGFTRGLDVNDLQPGGAAPDGALRLAR